MEGPVEHDPEDEACINDDRDYPESQGHDSGPDEDMAEDLSMAAEVQLPDDACLKNNPILLARNIRE
ncbi:unnamed protein product, partial [Trichogramma brassicae]